MLIKTEYIENKCKIANIYCFVYYANKLNMHRNIFMKQQNKREELSKQAVVWDSFL